MRPERGERWDQAELTLIKGLEREVRATEVAYLHDWRRDGLSGHSPLTAQIVCS